MRFVGLLNASVWLGAAVFFTLGAEPAMVSPQTQVLLQKSFSYYSPLLVGVLRHFFFCLSAVCGGVALLHLMAEWLYFGRPIRRFSFWLPMSLLMLALLNNGVLSHTLKNAHTSRFVAPTLPQRQAAQNSYSRWEPLSRGLDLVLILGLATYLVRVANPSDPLRFVGPGKFHS